MHKRGRVLRVVAYIADSGQTIVLTVQEVAT